MKLSDGVEAAIHCTALLAGLADDAVMSGPDLARFHGLSASYLVKHLKSLVGAGVLASVPGPKGGYKLARPPADISLLDVVLAVEGSKPAFRCAEIRRRGPDPLPISAYPAPCGIKVAMLAAEQVYRASLSSVTLADLLGGLEADTDPRVIARGCQFVERHQRQQPNT